MPKNRRLSKLEVIQYVIDYICELQYALDTHPTVNSAVVQASAAALMRQASPVQGAAPQTSPRQPLGVLAPNTILSAAPALACPSPDTVSTTPAHLLEKVSSPSDSRTVSC
uniref:BHLH domain-containing protein n=1 Tax=Graphocephala atropunctata TaxID=36148 RepID=A0A1B6MJK1_9HEMI